MADEIIIPKEIDFKEKYKKLRQKFFLMGIFVFLIVACGITAFITKPFQYIQPAVGFEVPAGYNLTIKDTSNLIINDVPRLMLGKDYPFIVGLQANSTNNNTKIGIREVMNKGANNTANFSIEISNPTSDDLTFNFYTKEYYAWQSHCSVWYVYTDAKGQQFMSCMKERWATATYDKVCLDQCNAQFNPNNASARDVGSSVNRCYYSCDKAFGYLVSMS